RSLVGRAVRRRQPQPRALACAQPVVACLGGRHRVLEAVAEQEVEDHVLVHGGVVGEVEVGARRGGGGGRLADQRGTPGSRSGSTVAVRRYRTDWPLARSTLSAMAPLPLLQLAPLLPLQVQLASSRPVAGVASTSTPVSVVEPKLVTSMV